MVPKDIWALTLLSISRKKTKNNNTSKKKIINTKGIVIYCVGSDDWHGDPIKF